MSYHFAVFIEIRRQFLSYWNLMIYAVDPQSLKTRNGRNFFIFELYERPKPEVRLRFVLWSFANGQACNNVCANTK